MNLLVYNKKYQNNAMKYGIKLKIYLGENLK